MKKRFSDEQIICILREAEAGVSARELCRKHAISDATFYTWRKKYGGMEVPEVKRLKSLLRKRTPDSRSCLLKPCWIRRRFRWLLGESTDDRPEAGSRGSHVRG
jgi:putative transposase